MIILLILVLIAALAFEYINGFHDAANAIATVVSTKVLTPRTAVLYGASLEFVGALIGTNVASTIGKGIVHIGCVTQMVILCALLGAIIWNLLTWYLGLPSSSSHALIGGLLGATIVHSKFVFAFKSINIKLFNIALFHTVIPVFKVVQMKGLFEKVIIPMITSPFIGITIGFVFMLILLRLTYMSIPDKVNKKFRKLQLVSSGMMALSHGMNDAQKTMGIITLALVSFGALDAFVVPLWVKIICAVMMACGTMSGGWKIIRTMGTKVIKLKPIHGFAAETAAASVIISASFLGIPLSTTHVISTSIMGVGSTQRLSAVKWGIVGNIVKAWIFTIPVCMILSGSIYFIIDRLLLGH